MVLSRRNLLICFGIAVLVASASAQRAAFPQTDGKFAEFPLPNPNSGRTTVSIAPRETNWGSWNFDNDKRQTRFREAFL